MISINDITVSFGGFNLLDNVSMHISENDKIGLVGRNGAGKSTLMKLITGEQSPTLGRIEYPSDLKIGYLPQIMKHNRGRSVLEEVLTVFSYLRDMEVEMERIGEELAVRNDYESKEYASLIERMNEINDTIALDSGETPEVRASKVLRGLGFKDEELSRKTETFSQGWNMRIELAKVLLSRPDVLLLDEPTNHLDIESISWFEDYLKAYRGALLLVSHDRKFLDNVTNRTAEILLGQIYDYKVPYSQYVTLREERISQQRAAYENQQRLIEKTEDFINRFRYKPTKSNQVQSRIKQLEKLERIEIDKTDTSTFRLRFPPAPRSGDVAFKGTDLGAGYPGKVVFSKAQIEVKRGEKVALIGRNGEGKTTLMRVIMGELAPISGTASVGYNVHIGYYAQNQEDILDGNETVFSTLDRVAVGEIRTKLRDLLGAFLFRGEDIDKKVSVLSGGERARLGMAMLMLEPYNLLALDEPTNHMDIHSKDILKQALKNYDGTLIVVSHDRDFLDGLVDKMYEFRDGKVREHLGTVSEFLQKRKMESLRDLEKTEPDSSPVAQQPGKAVAQERFDRNRAATKESRKIRSRIDYLEKEITKNERRMSEIEKKLANPTENDDIFDLTRDYLEAKRTADEMTEEWGRLQEELDN